ncbi:hypothetical protein BDN70DRAFT_901632 [Pholiota conissans]|uniref:Uncharacterized protein n=1 Tax=Pholiota conissans TaxID=109636 RepID=A0A9P6CLV9_9AGAR|nr:hypothetical protein BDN70DRAFT_901632 [Pholiota conissans]
MFARNWVSSIVRIVFPGVAARFSACAKWHEEQYGFKPLFGMFFNLYSRQAIPLSSEIVLPLNFPSPGKRFNHFKRTWLVLWEAAIAIHLPPWTMLAYPSSLLYHFNIDVADFKFVTTDGNERPTPQNSTPLEEGDDEGRGSLVYFNQASLYQSSELDHPTVAAAKASGLSGVVDFPSSVQEAFQKYSKFIPLERSDVKK